MKRYLLYLWYVLRHKYFVMVECFKMGLIWRGIIHDWDKFRPSSFIAYSKFFYEQSGRKKTRRDETGYYKPIDTGDKAFDRAWLEHAHGNRHHWQFYALVTKDGIKLYKMDIKDVKEMICDWKGAGKAQGTPDTLKWYDCNKDKMQLHLGSRNLIEKLLKK